MATTLSETAGEALSGRLAAGHRPGFALERAFYSDPSLHEHEVERIWRRSWLFAGHGCELRAPGDWLTFAVGDDSIVIVRAEDGALRAMHNTCRHRGMLVCEGRTGHARRLTCPYHQWVYGLDGSLRSCGGMEREGRIERASLGLLPVAVEEVGGLIFVFPGPDPTPFAEARAALEPGLRPQGLDRARVAATLHYSVQANWKLVWENNRECWHCHLGHPEYIQANFDTAAPDDERARATMEGRAGALSERLRAAGLEIDYRTPGLIPFPTPGRWWSINRTPLVEGFVTESLDGAAVAPRMGDYPAVDVGTLRFRTVPNFWCHASGDHAVSTRLVPRGPDVTNVQVQWLVDEDAVEGRDYELDRLLPFWQRTSEQDWALCERNQRGVRSPAYSPGPYSARREYNVVAFVDWYLERLTTQPVRGAA